MAMIPDEQYSYSQQGGTAEDFSAGDTWAGLLRFGVSRYLDSKTQQLALENQQIALRAPVQMQGPATGLGGNTGLLLMAAAAVLVVVVLVTK